MDLNKVMLIGNLTRDPETRTTPSGQTVTTFGLATNRSWVDASGQRQEKAEFHNIVAWAKLAEICNQYLAKGRRIFIEGRLQSREWTAEDGARRVRYEIVADNMIMLDRKTGAGPQALEESSAETEKKTEQEPASSGDEESGDKEIKVEQIPF